MDLMMPSGGRLTKVSTVWFASAVVAIAYSHWDSAVYVLCESRELLVIPIVWGASGAVMNLPGLHKQDLDVPLDGVDVMSHVALETGDGAMSGFVVEIWSEEKQRWLYWHAAWSGNGLSVEAVDASVRKVVCDQREFPSLTLFDLGQPAAILEEDCIYVSVGRMDRFRLGGRRVDFAERLLAGYSYQIERGEKALRDPAQMAPIHVLSGGGGRETLDRVAFMRDGDCFALNIRSARGPIAWLVKVTGANDPVIENGVLSPGAIIHADLNSATAVVVGGASSSLGQRLWMQAVEYDGGDVKWVSCPLGVDLVGSGRSSPWDNRFSAQWDGVGDVVGIDDVLLPKQASTVKAIRDSGLRRAK